MPATLIALVACARPASAQIGAFVPNTQYELADSVQLDEADSAVRSDLKRVKAYLDNRQWDEAVETLRGLMRNSASKLMPVSDRRYVGLREFGHLQLTGMPAEALALYRSRVDPLAREWYERGIATRDRRLLADVVRLALASSWGDDALLALGEMALESADYAAARSHWERIIPAEPPAEGPRTWLSYPDTKLDLAAVRARLVLVSILEGSTARAGDELARFKQLHGDARGRLGGVEVNYAEALASLLASSAAWPASIPHADWPTFAGSPWRERRAEALVDVGEPAWRVELSPPAPADDSSPRLPAIPRVAEDAARPLSYHPVLSGGLLLVNTAAEILALDARSGRPAWGQESAAVFRDQREPGHRLLENPPNTLGTARFTMSVFDGRLYARMGAGVTGCPGESPIDTGRGYLVCLDLRAEGRLMWKIEPEEQGWAFEGSPVADSSSVYVAMRKSDIRPQAHVACFDAETGRLRWRRFVCGAETPARGSLFESTHNLLTLKRETIYYNTNLGAVAALDRGDGQVRWVTLYPRQRSGDLLKPPPHLSRDLTPCLYHAGTLLVAPADSPRIYGLDAATGQILWQSGSQLGDVVHLLGVAGDRLIASGYRLYWIGMGPAEAGTVRHVWPDGAEKLGYGRGVLSGDSVLWPTREAVYVFKSTTGRLLKTINLKSRGATGGNVLVADGRLVVATSNELIAFATGRSEGGGQRSDGDVTAARSFTVPRAGTVCEYQKSKGSGFRVQDLQARVELQVLPPNPKPWPLNPEP